MKRFINILLLSMVILVIGAGESYASEIEKIQGIDMVVIDSGDISELELSNSLDLLIELRKAKTQDIEHAPGLSWRYCIEYQRPQNSPKYIPPIIHNYNLRRVQNRT